MLPRVPRRSVVVGVLTMQKEYSRNGSKYNATLAGATFLAANMALLAGCDDAFGVGWASGHVTEPRCWNCTRSEGSKEI
jgi:hypothetical protein